MSCHPKICIVVTKAADWPWLAALRQVERHLVNGDYVLFNRQPSLHKMSMMVRALTIASPAK